MARFLCLVESLTPARLPFQSSRLNKDYRGYCRMTIDTGYLLRIMSKLVSIDSVLPHEERLAAFVADELRGMMLRTTDVRAQEVLSSIAQDFDSLARLDQEDRRRIIFDWDKNRREDFIEAIMNAPFSHRKKVK